MATRTISQKYLKSILSYNPKTGVLRWKERPIEMFYNSKYQTRNWKVWNNRFSGEIAGCLRPDGYLTVRVKEKGYLAHQLIWLYVYGSWPKVFIDHLDMNRSNNRISNLREVTNSQNMHNRGPQSNNTSGYKGVYYDKQRGLYAASIKFNGLKIHLGRFKTAIEAFKAYEIKANELFGDSARCVYPLNFYKNEKSKSENI